jgi:hypothetical protein
VSGAGPLGGGGLVSRSIIMGDFQPATSSNSFSLPPSASRLVAKACRSWWEALAEHSYHPLVQVDLVNGHADAVGGAHAGIDQQQDDGGVTAAGDIPASLVLSRRTSCSARTTSTGCSGSWGGRMPSMGLA